MQHPQLKGYSDFIIRNCLRLINKLIVTFCSRSIIVKMSVTSSAVDLFLATDIVQEVNSCFRSVPVILTVENLLAYHTFPATVISHWYFSDS